ncbi:MAG: hypothetical protein LBT71_05210 [Azoarcus sp.]|jgi:hypothetical protein|nr:hypothetical protein [Azoarcus sp.]
MKLSMLSAAIIAMGLTMPATATVYTKIIPGTTFEAESGYRYCGRDRGAKHNAANHPDVITDKKVTGLWPLNLYLGSSNGKFVGNFTFLNYVEDFASTTAAGIYTAWVSYSTPYPGVVIEFQVVQNGYAHWPVTTPPLASSFDTRYNPTFANPFMFLQKDRWVRAPLQVFLPVGKFAFRVRNVGFVQFDYDKIAFDYAFVPPAVPPVPSN